AALPGHHAGLDPAAAALRGLGQSRHAASLSDEPDPRHQLPAAVAERPAAYAGDHRPGSGDRAGHGGTARADAPFPQSPASRASLRLHLLFPRHAAPRPTLPDLLRLRTVPHRTGGPWSLDLLSRSLFLRGAGTDPEHRRLYSRDPQGCDPGRPP